MLLAAEAVAHSMVAEVALVVYHKGLLLSHQVRHTQLLLALEALDVQRVLTLHNVEQLEEILYSAQLLH
jgi:hypothetical protein